MGHTVHGTLCRKRRFGSRKRRPWHPACATGTCPYSFVKGNLSTCATGTGALAHPGRSELYGTRNAVSTRRVAVKRKLQKGLYPFDRIQPRILMGGGMRIPVVSGYGFRYPPGCRRRLPFGASPRKRRLGHTACEMVCKMRRIVTGYAAYNTAPESWCGIEHFRPLICPVVHHAWEPWC